MKSQSEINQQLSKRFIDILSEQDAKAIDAYATVCHNGAYCNLKFSGFAIDSNPDGDVTISISLKSKELQKKIEEVTDSIIHLSYQRARKS